VRGPLDVLREEWWEASKKTDESVLSHILLVREIGRDVRAGE